MFLVSVFHLEFHDRRTIGSGSSRAGALQIHAARMKKNVLARILIAVNGQPAQDLTWLGCAGFRDDVL